MTNGWLHIYAQFSWHDDAVIVGDEGALRALRDAIDAAIGAGSASARVTFADDGEGYRVRIVRRPTTDLPMPYTDEIAADNSPFPHDLIDTLDELRSKDHLERAA